MPFKKGDKRPAGAGRSKGVPNKLTTKVKDAIEKAFDEEGGVEYLRGIAKSDPRTFCGLLKEIIPKDVTLEAGSTLAEILKTITGGEEESDD